MLVHVGEAPSSPCGILSLVGGGYKKTEPGARFFLRGEVAL